MPFCDRDGNKLYYEDSGAGPAIVFSHGAFLDHTIWEPVVERLSPTYRCITWDARGHGMSEANGPFDYWDLATDVTAILDAIGVQSAVLVGMSQGGWLTAAGGDRPPRSCAGCRAHGDLDARPVRGGAGRLQPAGRGLAGHGARR